VLIARALVRIVNSYFDAITSHDGTVALTHAGCGRVEKRLTGAGRTIPAAEHAGDAAIRAGGCATTRTAWRPEQ
jgi:hypothetical protein